MSAASTLRQEDVNRAVYSSPRVYRYYLSKSLTPAETACLSKYDPSISGRDVLDIGVGAGRTTHYLAPRARRYAGLDYSPVMVAYFKQAMPGIPIHQADFSDLSAFEDASFDFVLATDNVIDALSHEHRLRALRESARVLRPGGILAFSSHNLNYKRALSGPRLGWSSNPARLAKNSVKYILSWWNHLRVGRLRKTTAEYALLNDPGHFFACLHYYAARARVQSQLSDSGLQLIEAFDTNGRVVAESADDRDYPSLLYVAQT
jgi:SAM-dependent methyltransferase